MNILAIETSCDETSVAVLQNGMILSNIVATQIQKHRAFGGVVPELASRMHTEKINKIIQTALDESRLTLKDMTHIAVTQGPGLEGALLIGLTAAKTLAHGLNLPIIGINHLHGHIYAIFGQDEKPTFPFICTLVSGGHTQLILVESHFTFKLLGQTRDDAAGEAFDKVSRTLSLGYPGGPAVEKIAKTGNPKAISFPRAMLKEGYEFSFSGLKTAVIQYVKALSEDEKEKQTPDICASFQAAVSEILIHKALKACEEFQVSDWVIAGGVSCNGFLREQAQIASTKAGVHLFVNPPKLSTDNAGMIGLAAHFLIQHTKQLSNTFFKELTPKPNLTL